MGECKIKTTNIGAHMLKECHATFNADTLVYYHLMHFLLHLFTATINCERQLHH